MSVIIVNATATRSSGALSILNQFINNIPQNDIRYYIFIDYECKCEKKENIVYVQLNTRNWLKRIWWDRFGLKKWIDKNGLIPSLIISLQNMGVKYNEDVPQLIYYHQLLPLTNYCFRLYRKSELILLLYKHFYSYFVSYYIHSNSCFVVQIPSVKEAFLRKFLVADNQVYVISPAIPNVDYNKINTVCFQDDAVHFIYPATSFIYKNHIVLLKALQYLKENNRIIFDKVKIHITLKESEQRIFGKFIEYSGIGSSIIFDGTISFEKLLAYYKSMDALLFPSYIESFGLPLLEAAGAGMPIVVSDLAYAHDVIGEYEGVTYVNCRDETVWASAIVKICLDRPRYTPFKYNGKMGWKDFFELVDRLKIK